jgi:hypothetical protein
MDFPPAYTDIQRLHGSGDGTAARAKVAGGGDVFLKTMEPDRIWDDAKGTTEVEKSFGAAKLREQKAAAAEPKVFVDGHLERSGAAVFWVRPFLQGTLRDWVAFKEVPTPRRLSSVCLAMVRGLAALVRLDGGGHGNLTLGNVLLESKDQPVARLVDPLEAEPNRIQADKRALGLIIYQLVRSEFIELDGALTRVADDEDWRKQLGKTGQMWKALCSDLLDPYSALSQSDWEGIAARIEAIGTGRRSRGLLVLVPVLLLGGVLCGIFLLVQRSDDSVTVDRDRLEQQWVEVLDNYFTWARDLIESRRAFDNQGRAEERFAEVFDPKGSFEPAKIDNILGEIANLGALLSRNPDQAKRLLQDVKVLELKEAQQEQVVRVHRYLNELRVSIESWEVVAGLKQSRKDFEASGFEFGVEQMDGLLARIDFSSPFSYQELFELNVAAAEVASLQAAYARYERAVSQLESLSGSIFVREYANHLRRQLLEPVASPMARLKRLPEEAEKAQRIWRDHADALNVDLFQTAEAKFLETVDFGSATIVDDWGRVVRDFRQLDRQALEEPLIALRSKAKQSLRRLEGDVSEVLEPGMEPPDFLNPLNELSKRYEDAVPLVWIEKNRLQFEGAATALEQGIQQLESLAEQRLVELSPDVGEGLLALQSDLTAFQHPALQAKWESFRKSLFAGKTEKSFSSAPEFIRFRRRYQQQRERLQHYEQEQLAEIRRSVLLNAEFSSEALNRVGQDFLNALFKQPEDAFVAATGDLLFQAEIPAGRLEDELKRAKLNAAAEVEDLRAYLNELSQALNDFTNWEAPAAGFAGFVESLSASARRQAWSEDSRIRSLITNLRRGSETVVATSDELLGQSRDASEIAFIRFIALSRFAEIAQADAGQLEQLRAILGELGPTIPANKKLDWNKVVKEIWVKAFLRADTPSGKVSAMRIRDDFGIRALDLSGEARFAFELNAAIELVENSLEHYEKNPTQLKEIVDSFKTLPDPVARTSAEDLIRSLGAINISGDAGTQPTLPFLERGWRVAEQTEDRMILEWSGHQKTFHRVSGLGRDFFICETELSIQLFSDWMEQDGYWERFETDIPDQWRRFVRQRYSPSPRFDERMGLRLWDPSRAGLLKSPGLQRPATWFGGFDSLAQEDFSQSAEAELAPPSELSFELPMQHLGARLAQQFADSMGMRLPSREEWRVMVTFGDQGKLRSWSEAWGALVAVPLYEEMQRGSFYDESGIASSGLSQAEGQLILAVDQGDGTLKHLGGNVAEFIYEPEEDRFYIAGGSAVGEVAGTWAEIHPLRQNDEHRSYSDVGLRVCFNAPIKSPPLQFLNQMKAKWDNL